MLETSTLLRKSCSVRQTQINLKPDICATISGMVNFIEDCNLPITGLNDFVQLSNRNISDLELNIIKKPILHFNSLALATHPQIYISSANQKCTFMIIFISKDKLLNFPILKWTFMLYNSVYLSDESFLTYAISLLGICMCVCYVYASVRLFAFSTYWTDDIPEDTFLWESEVNFSSFPDLESGKALGI